MADLKEFLASLATDPRKLGEFIHDPESAMSAADLSDEDKAALRSGFPALIHARLSGLSTEEAFGATLRPPVSPQQFAFPVQIQAPQIQAPQFIYQIPPQFIYQIPPQYQVPPQFIHQIPPQYQIPPQFIHQIPPQYQIPPQFIHQIPPQYQIPPQFIHQIPPQFIHQIPPQFIYQLPPQLPPQYGTT
jgi:hypothetical protein